MLNPGLSASGGGFITLLLLPIFFVCAHVSFGLRCEEVFRVLVWVRRLRDYLASRGPT